MVHACVGDGKAFSAAPGCAVRKTPVQGAAPEELLTVALPHAKLGITANDPLLVPLPDRDSAGQTASSTKPLHTHLSCWKPELLDTSMVTRSVTAFYCNY